MGGQRQAYDGAAMDIYGDEWGGDIGDPNEFPRCGNHTSECQVDVRGVCEECMDEADETGSIGFGEWPPANPDKRKDR